SFNYATVTIVIGLVGTSPVAVAPALGTIVTLPATVAAVFFVVTITDVPCSLANLILSTFTFVVSSPVIVQLESCSAPSLNLLPSIETTILWIDSAASPTVTDSFVADIVVASFVRGKNDICLRAVFAVSAGTSGSFSVLINP